VSDVKLAAIKYNGGEGAVLCNECSVILAKGVDHTDCVHLCKDCYESFKEDYEFCSSYR
jgi:hypothetical protein